MSIWALNQSKKEIAQVRERLGLTPYQFSTVEDMKLSTVLNNGDVCITFGDKIVGDSLNKVFKIVSSEDQVPDGITEYVTLDSGQIAYLFSFFSKGDEATNIVLSSLIPLNINTALNSETILSYKFSMLSSGYGTVKYYVDSILKATNIISTGEIHFDISPYITTTGNHVVEVVVSNTSGGSASLTYVINVISLSITSIFDDSGFYTGDITFRYTPYGAFEKTIHFVMDGTEIATEQVSTSGIQWTKIIPAQSHGAHKLEVYSTAQIGDNTIVSNKLSYTIITYEVGNDTVIIASDFEKTEATQGEILNIGYRVYDPRFNTANVDLYINDELVNSLIVDRTAKYWNIVDYPVGEVTFTIMVGAVTKVLTVNVSPPEIDIQPVDVGLELYLSSAGRSNYDINKEEWGYGDIQAVLTGFNYGNNGWVLDDRGESVLRLTGDARVHIPFNLFAGDPRVSGFTFEIEFATRNVADYNAEILTCMDGNIGISITAQDAKLSSELMNDTVSKAIHQLFKEDEKIRIAFVIEPRTANRFIMTYINGICSGVQVYDINDNFTQNNPVGITIGSNEVGVDIYSIRKYGSALSAQEILNNYIADIRIISDKIDLYNKNNIFDDYSNVDYGAMLNVMPCMTFIGELPPSKGEKRTVQLMYKNKFDPTKDIDLVGDVTLDVQGTSSQYYPRKNYKFKLKDMTYKLTDTAIPEKVFCLKADYMESSHAHNTGNAILINDLMLKVSPVPPQLSNPSVRTTIYGFPIAVFHQETIESPRYCLGVFNFNNDKDDVDTFGQSGEAECWEFCDNSAARCNFLTWDDPDRPVSSDFEARYPDKSTDYTALERVVRWVASTNGDIDKFKNEISQYFDLNSLLAYFVIAMLINGTDSMAKNLFISTWDKLKWYPIFYDIDTCYGLNNEGVLGFGYNTEFTDVIGTQYVFNGHNSVLWNNLEQAFPDEIAEMYRYLRINGLDYDNFINVLVGRQIKAIPEALYNYDARFRYIEPYINGTGTYLYCAQGSREAHLRWWLSKRFDYLDSKYNAGPYASDFITMRIYTPEGSLPVTPSGVFNIETSADQYVSVRYGAIVLKERAKKDEVITITPPPATYNDTETVIYGASRIKDIGNLADKYVGTIDVSAAKQLSRLIVGSDVPGYSNTNLLEVHVGNNPLLKVIDVRNCPNLAQPLDLSGCENIEEIYATGTSITSVNLADGGNLKKMYLPDSIVNLTLKNQRSITDFFMDGYTNLSALRVENCTGVPIETIINGATNLARIRLTGLDITTSDDTLLQKLRGYAGIDEFGNNIEDAVVTGKWHLTEVGENTLLQLQEAFPELTITYTTLIKEYEVRFVNWDGTVLDVQYVREGQAAVDPITREINPIPIPTRIMDAQFTYEFLKWDISFDAIFSDRTITALYTSTTRTYEVRFIHGDTILEVQNVLYGGNAEYSGDYPTLEGYVFNGWNPPPYNITGPTDCYATFVELIPPSQPKDFKDYTWAEIKSIKGHGRVDFTLTGVKSYGFDHPNETFLKINMTEKFYEDIPGVDLVLGIGLSPDGTKLAVYYRKSTTETYDCCLKVFKVLEDSLEELASVDATYSSSIVYLRNILWINNNEFICNANFTTFPLEDKLYRVVIDEGGINTSIILSEASSGIFKTQFDNIYVIQCRTRIITCLYIDGVLTVLDEVPGAAGKIHVRQDLIVAGYEDINHINEVRTYRINIDGTISIIGETTPLTEMDSKLTWKEIFITPNCSRVYLIYSSSLRSHTTITKILCSIGVDGVDFSDCEEATELGLNAYDSVCFYELNEYLIVCDIGSITSEHRTKLYTLTNGPQEYLNTFSSLSGIAIRHVSYGGGNLVFVSDTGGVFIFNVQEAPVFVPWFSVGDIKPIQLSTGECVDLQIYDLENNIISGTGEKALLTLGTKDTLNENRRLNQTATNIGGWHSTEMRSWLNNTLIKQLPSELGALLETVIVKTAEGNKSSVVINDNDKIFIPASKELGTSGGFDSERDVLEQFPIYSDNSSRIKSRTYFTRTASTTDTSRFAAITSSGSESNVNANALYGVVFCVCL